MQVSYGTGGHVAKYCSLRLAHHRFTLYVDGMKWVYWGIKCVWIIYLAQCLSL